MSQSPPYWNPEATPFAPMSSQQPTPLSADAAVFVPPMDLPSDFYNPPAFLEYGMTQPGDLQQFDDGYFSTPSGSPYWSDGEEVVVAQSIEDGWPPVDAEQMLLPCELEGSQGVDALPLVGIADPVVDYYGANAIGENDFNAAMSPPEPYIPKRSVTKKHPGAINAGVKKSAKKVPSKKRMSPRQEEELGMLFLSVSDKHKMANVVIDKQDKMRDYAQRLGQNVRVTRTHGRITIEGVFWTAPQNDPSIPRSHVDQVACVQQLVAAMLDTSVCKEKKTTTAFQNRWGAGATFYSAEEFQHAAWTLVDFAVDVHTNGWTKTITDKHIRDSVQKTMYCTFSDRFEAMRKLLSGSKRTCEGILKGEKMANVVGNPWELDTRTTSNKNSNEVKGDKLQRATKRDREEMEKSEAREKEAARPVKKARARKD